jgi:hypothetical protein
MVPTTTRTFRSIYGVLNNRRFLCVQSMFRNVMGCSVRCRRARSHRETMPCSLDNRFTHLALSSPLVSAALAIQLPISEFGPPTANRPCRNRKLEKEGRRMTHCHNGRGSGRRITSGHGGDNSDTSTGRTYGHRRDGAQRKNSVRPLPRPQFAQRVNDSFH